MRLTSSQLRQAFLDYFAKQGHKVVPSSSLVPANDPTLLFTNAGMVQFKDCFLGKDKRDYVRAVSSQRCVLALTSMPITSVSAVCAATAAAV